MLFSPTFALSAIHRRIPVIRDNTGTRHNLGLSNYTSEDVFTGTIAVYEKQAKITFLLNISLSKGKSYARSTYHAIHLETNTTLTGL